MLKKTLSDLILQKLPKIDVCQNSVLNPGFAMIIYDPLMLMLVINNFPRTTKLQILWSESTHFWPVTCYQFSGAEDQWLVTSFTSSLMFTANTGLAGWSAWLGFFFSTIAVFSLSQVFSPSSCPLIYLSLGAWFQSKLSVGIEYCNIWSGKN